MVKLNEKRIVMQQKNYREEILRNSKDVILGKDEEILISISCFLAGGHLLIEDAPGMGKTTFAKLISKLLGLSFMRVQFTSDLMPSDLIGANIFNSNHNQFNFFKGPIFTELLLADELNRASPKTQSALLQAMEEREVSVDRQTYKLSELFFVIATQNPNTQKGTNPLPESQLDRFTICLSLGYPSREDELRLLSGFNSSLKLESVRALWSKEEIIKIKSEIEGVNVSTSILNSVMEVLQNSRNNNACSPLSPRCGVDIVKCLKAYSYLNGRRYVLPDDLKLLGPQIIIHRSRLNNHYPTYDHFSKIKFDN